MTDFAAIPTTLLHEMVSQTYVELADVFAWLMMGNGEVDPFEFIGLADHFGCGPESTLSELHARIREHAETCDCDTLTVFDDLITRPVLASISAANN